MLIEFTLVMIIIDVGGFHHTEATTTGPIWTGRANSRKRHEFKSQHMFTLFFQ